MSTTIEPRKHRRIAPVRDSAPTRTATWHATAPTQLRRAAQQGQPPAEWQIWVDWLASRKQPRLPRLARACELPFSTVATGGLLDILARAARGKRRAVATAAEHVSHWLRDAVAARGELRHGLECLAWGRALPSLAGHLVPQRWWAVVWHLLDAADAAHKENQADIARLLVGAELPLTLALLFPEIDDCRRGAIAAVRWFDRVLANPEAGQRQCKPAELQQLRATLACWTRSRALAECWKKRRELVDGDSFHGKRDPLGREAKKAFRRLLLAVIRWTGPDGGQLLSTLAGDASEGSATHAASTRNGDPGAPGFSNSPILGPQKLGPSPHSWRDLKKLVRHAVQLDGSRETRRIGRAVLKGGAAGSKKYRRLPCPGAPFEAASTAVLRSRWSRRGVALAVAFDRGEMQVEMSDGRQALLCGSWPVELTRHGRPLPTPRAGWDIVCWESDRDAQWLEMELTFAEGVRVERGILLAPREEFVLLLDAVIGPRGEEIEYATRLPLTACVRPRATKETTELELHGQRPLARVLPLALSEWRSDAHAGRMALLNGGLELRQSSREGALCAPLFIDYARKRRKKPLTWRQLTVGESGRPVGRDVAAGYRVQIGRRQWLGYRALRSRSTRTLLGQNVNTELQVARFLRNGDVKTILEIE